MKKLKKILLKTSQALLILLALSFMAFILIRLAPSDPASVKASSGTSVLSPSEVSALRTQMGLDAPWYVQYGNWLWALLHLNLGESLLSGQAIATLLLPALINTLQLAFLTMLFALPLALITGFYLALGKGVLAKLLNRINLLGIALPSFVLAYLLIYLFSLQWPILPILAKNGGVGLIMPLVTLLVPVCAKLSQEIAALVLSEFQKPYAQALAYRGLSQQQIARNHILKNILPTLVTLAALSLGSLLSGVVVVETIFYWPGLGKLLMDALLNRDYTVVQVCLLLIGLFYLALTGLSHYLQGTLDYRMKGRTDAP